MCEISATRKFFGMSLFNFGVHNFKMKQIILQCVLIFSLCEIIVAEITGDICSNDGYFSENSDPTCRKFFRCISGIKYEFECDEDLRFNQACSCCDFKYNVPCTKDNSKISTSVRVTGSSTTSDETSTSVISTSASAETAASMSTSASSTFTTGSETLKKKVVCYYPSWTHYRQGQGKYTIEDINAEICTHIIYSFAILDGINHIMKSHDNLLDLTSGLGYYEKFVELRKKSPNAKFMIALGGWNDSRSPKYSELLKNSSLRAKFVNEALIFLKKHNFQGLDLDYEYPAYNGVETDKAGFSAWVKELKKAFEPFGYELTAAVAMNEATIHAGYDVTEISKYLDAIHVMTYDAHGSWEPNEADHHAPLYHEAWHNGNLNVNYSINLWLRLGCPKEKLILGIPTYGRAWKLAQKVEESISFPLQAQGAASSGILTGTPGMLSYTEICLKIKEEGWTEKTTPGLNPYAFGNNEWVGYDTPSSAVRKAKYALSMEIGGIMFWDLASDDPKNLCGNGANPIISASFEAIKQ